MDHPASTNDLAVTLESGDVALGLLDVTYSSTIVEIYGELDLDFVWIDLERGSRKGVRAVELRRQTDFAERAEPGPKSKLDAESAVRCGDSSFDQ